jgi:uncharacterized membrane protein YcaP (DUF421 family)
VREDFRPFDLDRMFIGDFSILLTLEIVVRTGFMYLAAIVIVRYLGKRGLGQISPFEYVVVFALGSATGDPMFYPEVPLLHGVVVLVVIVLLQKALVSASERNAGLQRYLEGSPTILIQSGTVLDDAARREGVSREELLMRLRQAGVTNVGQVQYAFLETSGQLSVFTEAERRGPGQSTLDLKRDAT